MKILRLNLKAEYFDAIKAGTKTEEYRLKNEYWARRLLFGGFFNFSQTFDEIHLLKGYPKNGDETRIIRRKWNGLKTCMLIHPHFGKEPVSVFAIDVSKEVE